MIKRPITNIQEAERLICLNIKSFIADLCLIDKSFLVEHITNENHHVLNDIIESASEMFFRAGTLCYNYNACLSERINTAPSICLDMRFSYQQVLIPFRLHIEDDYAGVSLTREMLFAANPSLALTQLSDALDDARISRHTFIHKTCSESTGPAMLN